METAEEEGIPSHDAIARRAYEIYESRSREPGFDLEDWTVAEQELSHATSEAPEYAEVIPLAGESDKPVETSARQASKRNGNEKEQEPVVRERQA